MPRGRPKGSTWSDDAKARGKARAAAQRTGNLSRGTEVGKGEWLIVSPTGETFRVRGLQAWCRANTRRFPGLRWEQIRSGLSSVQRGQTSVWMGWIARRTDI